MNIEDLTEHTLEQDAEEVGTMELLAERIARGRSLANKLGGGG